MRYTDVKGCVCVCVCVYLRREQSIRGTTVQPSLMVASFEVMGPMHDGLMVSYWRKVPFLRHNSFSSWTKRFFPFNHRLTGGSGRNRGGRDQGGANADAGSNQPTIGALGCWQPSIFSMLVSLPALSALLSITFLSCRHFSAPCVFSHVMLPTTFPVSIWYWTRVQLTEYILDHPFIFLFHCFPWSCLVGVFSLSLCLSLPSLSPSFPSSFFSRQTRHNIVSKILVTTPRPGPIKARSGTKNAHTLLFLVTTTSILAIRRKPPPPWSSRHITVVPFPSGTERVRDILWTHCTVPQLLPKGPDWCKGVIDQALLVGLLPGLHGA